MYCHKIIICSNLIFLKKKNDIHTYILGFSNKELFIFQSTNKSSIEFFTHSTGMTMRTNRLFQISVTKKLFLRIFFYTSTNFYSYSVVS